MFKTFDLLPFRRTVLSTAAVFAVTLSAGVSAATLAVGPGKTFAAPCAAFAAAANGDTIEIDAAGAYNGDVCVINASNLTIRGVNGRPRINANGQNAIGKGTWVLYGAGTTIENVEMYGAHVPDQNGAAIRLDGRDLTLRGSYLHDNENGILTSSDGVSNVVIENSEFAYNGLGNGYTHNLYIGNINSLVFRGSYSHDAKVGHLLKSRAKTNTVVYSRFSSSTEQPSYEIDLPNAGTSYVIGNIIQQPAANQAATMLSYGEEGASNPGQDLYVVNNTFLNDDSVRGTFVQVGSGVTTPVLLQNNILSGTGYVSSQANTIDQTNYRTLAAPVVDRGNFDLHPLLGSVLAGAGSAVGNAASGMPLAPTMQYKHVAGTEARPAVGAIDIGAYSVVGAVAQAAQAAPSLLASVAAVTASPFTAAVTQAAAAAPSNDGWTTCAAENGSCSFSGMRMVRYGANNVYVYRYISDAVDCNNASFGDPLVGVAKSCQYAG